LWGEKGQKMGEKKGLQERSTMEKGASENAKTESGGLSE